MIVGHGHKDARWKLIGLCFEGLGRDREWKIS